MAKLDESKDTQDNTSEDTKGTSEKEPETFTKEEMAEATRKTKSDALAEVGRLKKSTDTAIKAAQAATGRLDQMIKDQEDEELKAAAGNTEQLSAIKERQMRRLIESKLATVETERDEKDEELKLANADKAEVTKERNAREIATRLSVSPSLLAKLAKSTDGSIEAIEEIANELPKKGETPTLKVDSGKTSGGGRTYKSEEILETLDPSKMTPQEISTQVAELAKAQGEGRIK